MIKWPRCPTQQEFSIPCGRICTSYRAELAALRKALDMIADNSSLTAPCSIWIFTDSESAVERLQQGPGAQVESLAQEVWKLISSISIKHRVILQWIPGHKDLEGNEAADVNAKEGSKMDQHNIVINFQTIKAAIKQHVRRKWREAVLARKGIYSKAKITDPPALPSHISRKEETTIHQLRTGVSPLVRSC